MSFKLLSIIICTRNRAEELKKSLPFVVIPAKKHEDVEIIVINNGSTDNTEEIVQKVSKEQDFPVRHIFESVPGLCQARNRGRNEAKGEILAYIDDDILVDENWINMIKLNFQEESCDSLGGPVNVEIEGEAEFAINEDMLWFFGKRDWGNKKMNFVFPDHPVGGNMAFRTKLFDLIGGFNTNLKLYGDESDFFRRGNEVGVKMLYDSNVIVKQVIPANRLTKDELSHKSYLWGQGSATGRMLAGLNGAKRIAEICKYAGLTAYMVLRSKLNNDFGMFYTYWYNRGFLNQLMKGLEKILTIICLKFLTKIK